MFEDAGAIWVAILAQAAKPAEEPAPAAQAADQFLWWLPMVAIGVLFYFMLIRPQRKEQVQRQDMLKALKKHDKVVTIGGIVGSIANVSADGETVTLKVDDNTRLT